MTKARPVCDISSGLHVDCGEERVPLELLQAETHDNHTGTENHLKMEEGDYLKAIALV